MFRKLGPWFIFVATLFVMSLGIALVTRGNLGTTPISSLPLVSSYASGLTFGETTFFINLLFVAAQWPLLRKSINKLLLLSQIPITFAFSYFIDTSMQITEFLSSDIYWKCFAVSMLGNVVLGLGVALEVFSGAAALPGEGLVLAVSTVLHKPFSSVKIANDVILVLLALLLSYCVFHEIHGLREGTVISALCVGIFVKFWLAGLTKLFKRAPAEIGEFKSGSMSWNRQLQGLADSKYRFEFR